MLNPLSADDRYLRTDLKPGLVRAAEHNWSVRERDIRLFEIGVVFHKAATPRPQETLRLAAVVSGARTPSHWSGSGKSPDYDLWDLKHLFEEALRVGGPTGRVVPDGTGWALEDASGRVRGRARELESDRPAWAGRLLGLEIDLEVRPGVAAHYQALPTAPPVERDLAVVLPPDVSAAQVEAVMRRGAGPLLERVGVFDEYRAAEFEGRSVAWRLIFRAPDRTLRDEEIDPIVKRILTLLLEELSVRLRES